MPYSPLVSKIRVHNPNTKKAIFANREYVKYIATREGVSLDSVEETEDVKMHYGAENTDYLKYIADRPRSHGLFGNIDTEDLKKVQNLIANETESGKVIYRGIISLSEKDGEALGFTSSKDWNLYLKKTIPDICKILGISSIDNTWVAAFHAEQSHPHVHYMLWENGDNVRSPFIHKSTQKKIRSYLEKEMFDNEYEKSIRKVFEKELSELNDIRNTERKNLMISTEKAMREIGYVPGMQSVKLPIRPSTEYMRKLTEQINSLITVLPEHGRLNYKFLPSEAKEQIQMIVDTLLEKPEMGTSVKEYLDAVVKTNEFYGKTQTDIKHERKKAESDIRKRIANRVLTTVKNAILDEKNISKAEEKYYKEKQEGTGYPLTLEKRMEEIREHFSNLEEQERLSFPLALEKRMEEIREHFINLEEQEGTGYPSTDREEQEGTGYPSTDREEQEGTGYPSTDGEEQEGTGYPSTDGEEQEGTGYPSTFEERMEEMQERFAKLYEGNNMYTPFDNIDKNYYLDWNQDYKLAMKCIYNEDGVADFEKGFKILEKEAINGNSLAIYETAKLIDKFEINGVQKKEAVEYYKEAFEAFNKIFESADNVYKKDYAAYRIGKMYSLGQAEDGITDYNKAASWYQQSGNNYAKYSLGMLYISNKFDVENEERYTTGRILLENANPDKIPFAAYELGNIYSKGIGTEVNTETGQAYYKKAFDKFNEMVSSATDSNLIYRLGDMYLKGLGTEVNLDKGEQFVKKAAELGNDTAKYKLALLYLEREDDSLQKQAITSLEELAKKENIMARYALGTIYMDKENPEYYNLEKAVSYLEEAAEQGNQFAQYRLGTIYMDEENPEYYNLEKAVSYLEEAAEQGNQFAQYRLGTIYMDEENPEYYNLEKAVSYLEEAAEQGNQFAQYRLGTIYMDEENPEYYNLEKAVSYLDEAAKQENEFAQYRLGTIYCDKNYVNFNMQRSIDYFTSAAEHGNVYAQCRLGCIYYFGKDTLQEKEIGAYWLNKAAAQGDDFAKRVLDGQMVGLNFSYCLLKGVLSSVETLNKNMAFEQAQMNRTNSRQAVHEKALHHDNSFEQE